MATLYGRAGDVQAFKALAAARQANTNVTFVPLADLAAVRAKAAGPFGIATLVLQLASGIQLTAANAIVKYLGGGSGSIPIEVQQWLEWEESTLRPATFLAGDTLAAALAYLEAALGSRNFLVGDKASLADVAVAAALLPVFQSPALTAFVARVQAGEGVQAALEQSGAATEALSAVHAADAAAYRASRPKLPIPGARNILITSALPYVNNVPHLGNIIGCVLSADAYARYCRSRGHNCIYVCGTDEYGTATETKALEEGLTCQQICDKYHAIHADIYAWFDIQFDRFGRTPTRAQTSIAQSIFQRLQDNGQLVEQEGQQLYSEAAGKFLADRFVYGICPKCSYEDARGDQCDNCGNLLNPTELIQPKCKLTGTTPVLRPTRHIYLDLPKLTPELQDYITTTSELGGWSSNCVGVTNAWMRDGLKNRCITRDLKWGTPVPMPGYEKKVFYVWFDAPIGYISITANYTPEWEAWWKNPKDVEMVQFMGKDNVPFHTVIFPATLLGTKDSWTMMKNISVTEYLNYEGGKFSKSRGTGVFGNDAKDTGIPADVWRYYLLANRPETSDNDFKWSDLAARNNAELLANLGNFINRALMFVSKFFGGIVPSPTEPLPPKVTELGETIGAKVDEYIAALEKIKIKEGARLLMAASSDGNRFLQETQPWVLLKTDPPAAASVVAAAVGLVRVLAVLMQPYMPSLSGRVRQQLQLQPADLQLSDALVAGCRSLHTLVPAGHALATPSPLIKEIPEELVEALRARYGGSQADRQDATASGTTSATASATPAKGKDKAAAAASSTSGATKPAPDAGKGKDRGAAGKGKAAAGTTAAGNAGSGASTATSEGSTATAAAGGTASSTGAGGTATDGTAAALASGADQPKGKKERVPKEKGAGGGGGGPKKEEEAPPDVSKLDIRVAVILKAWKHPDADSLYVEEVDVGEATPRQVVSGLVKYISDAASLTGRRVLIVANMKPANMRGVSSQAMVLAASNAEGTQLELLEPPAGAPVGERVACEGFPGAPDEVLNPKKRVFEQVHPDLSTNAACVATYKGVPLTTSAGPITVPSLVGATVR